MRASKEHNFLFVSSPKCGTITFYNLLERAFGASRVGCGFHANMVPEECKDLYRWTITRNPYERAVSLWWSAVHLHDSDSYGLAKGCGSSTNFVQFVEWVAGLTIEKKSRLGLLSQAFLNSQSEHLRNAGPFAVVLRLESINQEVLHLPFWKRGIQILEKNTTREKQDAHSIECRDRLSWWDFYQDTRALNAVNSWLGEDFEGFGYTMEIR